MPAKKSGSRKHSASKKKLAAGKCKPTKSAPRRHSVKKANKSPKKPAKVCIARKGAKTGTKASKITKGKNKGNYVKSTAGKKRGRHSGSGRKTPAKKARAGAYKKKSSSHKKKSSGKKKSSSHKKKTTAKKHREFSSVAEGLKHTNHGKYFRTKTATYRVALKKGVKKEDRLPRDKKYRAARVGRKKQH